MDKQNIYKKYIKYRIKYLDLIMDKSFQIGGASITTISNNGSGDNMLNQCMWISIRDYLNYHRGENRTVRALKQSVGLGPDTDHTEFDEENPGYVDALTRLCRQYEISIYLIVASRDGTVRQISLDGKGNLFPINIINPNAPNIVYIASFGNHFELIVSGPNYTLSKHSSSTSTSAPYEPKVKIHNIYVNVNPKEPKEKTRAENEILIVETLQDIDIYEREINIFNKEIIDIEEAIRNLSSTGLLASEIESIKKIYIANLEETRKLLVSLKSKQLNSIELLIQIYNNILKSINTQLEPFENLKKLELEPTQIKSIKASYLKQYNITQAQLDILEKEKIDATKIIAELRTKIKK